MGEMATIQGKFLCKNQGMIKYKVTFALLFHIFGSNGKRSF